MCLSSGEGAGCVMCHVCYTMRALLNSPSVSIDLSSGEGAGCVSQVEREQDVSCVSVLHYESAA